MTSCYESISCPRNSLARSPTLSQGLRRQEAKSRIYYLRDDHSDDIFSQIKLSSRTASYYMQVSSVALRFAWSLQKLVFVLAARTLVGAHRDGLVLAPNTLQPEIQPLIFRGQIVSGVLPLLTDRQTHRRTTIILV